MADPQPAKQSDEITFYQDMPLVQQLKIGDRIRVADSDQYVVILGINEQPEGMYQIIFERREFDPPELVQ